MSGDDLAKPRKSASFQERLLTERRFHDEWAQTIDPETVLVREAFEAVTASENGFVRDHVGKIAGKRLLDVGCGAGEAAIYFAQQGAVVTALDISGAFLRVVRQLSAKYAVPVDVIISPVEFLPFPDNTFDVIYGNSVLHHLDFHRSMREIHRVLKPGGRAFFIEPLAYNPIINVYRYMAGTMRTPDEKPLRFADLRALGPLFSRVEHREFWLLAQLVFLWFLLGMRVHPNRERYWKKIIYDADKIAWLFEPLRRLDERILRRFSFLSRLCWNTVVHLEK